jgi:hypothetical protein
MEKTPSVLDRRLSGPQCWSQHNDKAKNSDITDKTILIPDIRISFILNIKTENRKVHEN